MILVFCEEDVTGCQVSAANDYRVRCRADHSQIGVSFNPELRSPGVQLAGAARQRERASARKCVRWGELDGATVERNHAGSGLE